MLYFQHKDKVHLFYSLYTFLIFINQTKFVFADPSATARTVFEQLLFDMHEPIVWVYNTFYFVFGFTFLNLRSYSKKCHSFIFGTVKLLFVIISIIVLSVLITKNQSFIDFSRKGMRLSLYSFGAIAYNSLFAVKMPLRKYIIVGSFMLYASSFIAEYADQFFVFLKNTNAANSVFYIGVIIENIIFSLGLGQKQKLILNQKNESQRKLIKQLKENEVLKQKIHDQLEEDLITYSKKAEKEKFEKIKLAYEKELLALKISSLQSQMNPHFIFNSLNAIKLYIIDNKKENAVYYLNKFSKLIRKILAAAREKENSLAEEIDTLRLYIDIENIRFQNEIKASFTIDKKLNLGAIKMPSLIVQPFVENAIWHGLSSKKDCKEIALIFEKEKDLFLKITIIDNGIGRKKAAAIKKKKLHKKDSIGIQLTKERLKNYTKNFKHPFHLEYHDLYSNLDKAMGTKVILSIPLK